MAFQLVVPLGRTQRLGCEQRGGEPGRPKLVVAIVSALLGTRALHLAHQVVDVMNLK